MAHPPGQAKKNALPPEELRMMLPNQTQPQEQIIQNVPRALRLSGALENVSPFQVVRLSQDGDARTLNQSLAPLIARPQLQHGIVVVPSLSIIPRPIIPNGLGTMVARPASSGAGETIGIQAVAMRQQQASAASLSTSLLANSLLAPHYQQQQQTPNWCYQGGGQLHQGLGTAGNVGSNLVMGLNIPQQAVRGVFLPVPMHPSASFLAAAPDLTQPALEFRQQQQQLLSGLSQNASSLGGAAAGIALMGCTSPTTFSAPALSANPTPVPSQPLLPPTRPVQDMSLQPDPPAPADFFPDRLHLMLSDVEKAGKQDIVGYFPHGRAFCVFKPDKFVSEIMPKFYNKGKLSSFQRQLNLYGFTRIAVGPDVGGYYHVLFLRGRPGLCQKIRRLKNTRKHKDGGEKGKVKNELDESKTEKIPNFYDMPPITTAEEAEAMQGTFGASGTTVPALPDTSLSLEGALPSC